MILLQKLELYGFRGKSNDWFGSYLKDRMQSVSFGNSVSDGHSPNYDVPQGSVLGPILFMLYVNDFVNLDVAGRMTTFADDATILWNHKNQVTLCDMVNRDLKSVKKWCDSNGLCFNVSKYCVMSFKCSLNNVYLEDNTINELKENKFLGLFIDRNLKFESHIKNLTNRLSSNCYALRVNSRELDHHTSWGAYFALIESHMRYGIFFWGTCSRQLFRSVLEIKNIRKMYG